jgi:predicted transcriptional regulator
MKDTHVLLEAQQIKVLEDKIIQAIKIIKSTKLATSFDPSMKTLMRIVEFMTKNSSEGKTQLALDTKLNYARLAKHIVWMEKKGLAKSIVEDGKINIALTETGKDFAKIISKII